VCRCVFPHVCFLVLLICIAALSFLQKKGICSMDCCAVDTFVQCECETFILAAVIDRSFPPATYNHNHPFRPRRILAHLQYPDYPDYPHYPHYPHSVSQIPHLSTLRTLSPVPLCIACGPPYRCDFTVYAHLFVFYCASTLSWPEYPARPSQT
jgi:hypothetical protein